MSRSIVATGVWMFALVAGSQNSVVAGTFTLNLVADSTVIVPGEPLWVRLSARNDAKDTERFSLRSPEFLLEYGNEGFRDIRTSAIVVSSGAGKAVHPNEELKKSILLSFEYQYRRDADTFVPRPLFQRPGKYRLKWAHQGLESNVVDIQVRPPDSLDRDASQLYSHQTMVNWLDFGQQTDLDRIDSLNRVIQVAPNSPFADHAHMRLAEYFEVRCVKSPRRNYLAHGRDDNVWGRTEVQDWCLSRALTHYEAVSKRNEPLHARALYAAAAVLVDNWYYLSDDVDISGLADRLEESAKLADTLAIDASEIRSRLRELIAEGKKAIYHGK